MKRRGTQYSILVYLTTYAHGRLEDRRETPCGVARDARR